MTPDGPGTCGCGWEGGMFRYCDAHNPCFGVQHPMTDPHARLVEQIEKKLREHYAYCEMNRPRCECWFAPLLEQAAALLREGVAPPQEPNNQ